jgi:hypothetical protein
LVLNINKPLQTTLSADGHPPEEQFLIEDLIFNLEKCVRNRVEAETLVNLMTFLFP